MYRIGEFARLSGISEKTLRFYHQTGVFSPSAVNSRTGYRYYRPQQLAEAALILSMRQLGVPLAEIKGFSRELKAAPSRRRYLERTRGELQRALAEKAQALVWVESELRWIEQVREGPPIVLKRSAALPVASLRSRLSAYSDLEKLRARLLERIPGRCRRLIEGTLWHKCADSGSVEGEYFVWADGLPGPDKHVEIKTLPECIVASACCGTDDASSLATFSRIQQWTNIHGYQLTGPKREFYHADMIEIQFPVNHSLEAAHTMQNT